MHPASKTALRLIIAALALIGLTPVNAGPLPPVKPVTMPEPARRPVRLQFPHLEYNLAAIGVTDERFREWSEALEQIDPKAMTIVGTADAAPTPTPLKVLGEIAAPASTAQDAALLHGRALAYNAVVVLWNWDTDPQPLIAIIKQCRAYGYTYVIVAVSSPVPARTLYTLTPRAAAASLARVVGQADAIIPLWQLLSPLHWNVPDARDRLAAWLVLTAKAANPRLAVWGVMDFGRQSWVPVRPNALLVTQLTNIPRQVPVVNFPMLANRLRTERGVTGPVIFGPVYPLAPGAETEIERQLDRFIQAGLGGLRFWR